MSNNAKTRPEITAAWIAGIFGYAGVTLAAIIGLGLPFVQRLANPSEPKTIVVVVTGAAPQPITQSPIAISSILFTVYPNQAWNNTSINVNAGDSIGIQYQNGSWTYWAGTISSTDARGNPSYICAKLQPASKCLEPVPEAPTGALIARIG